MQDDATFRYFESFCPEYSLDRLQPAIASIGRYVPAATSLVDLGAGNGNVLAHLQGRTGIPQLTAIDTNPAALRRLEEAIRCRTLEGSILDDQFIARLEGRFDVVLMAAVLHHLVAGTRRRSRRLAHRAVANALRLVAAGGVLILVEPTFAPRASMAAVFWLKRLVTRFTDQRVEILGRWNNIGQPVVSFYSDRELRRMCRLAGAVLRDLHAESRPVNPLLRLGLVRYRHDTTLTVSPAGSSLS